MNNHFRSYDRIRVFVLSRADVYFAWGLVNNGLAAAKPALLSTGLTIQVPEHVATGDKIKVNVEERKFMGRAELK